MEPLTRVSDPWSSNDRYVSHGAARQLRWSPALVFQTRGAAMIGMSHMVQSCQLRADLNLVLHMAQGRGTAGVVLSAAFASCCTGENVFLVLAQVLTFVMVCCYKV